MNALAHPKTPPAPTPGEPETREERLADLRRRRAEAADVLAQALLDLWRKEQRAKRAAARAAAAAAVAQGGPS